MSSMGESTLTLHQFSQSGALLQSTPYALQGSWYCMEFDTTPVPEHRCQSRWLLAGWSACACWAGDGGSARSRKSAPEIYRAAFGRLLLRPKTLTAT
jgi:hypothetical protein